MPYSDLQDHLARLEKIGKLHWIEQQVDPAWEVSAITRHVFDRYGWDERPALGFRRVGESPFPLVIGVIGGSPEIYALALSTNVEDIPKIRERGPRAGASGILIISMKKEYPEQVKEVAFGAWSLMHKECKFTIVDEDIDVRNSFQVEWAMSFHAQPARDLFTVSGVRHDKIPVRLKHVLSAGEGARDSNITNTGLLRDWKSFAELWPRRTDRMNEIAAEYEKYLE